MTKQMKRMLLLLFAVTALVLSALSVRAEDVPQTARIQSLEGAKGIMVQAATARQTGAGTKTIKVEWDDPCASYANLTTTSYIFKWGESVDSLTHSVKLSSSTRVYVIKNVAASSKYYCKVYVNYKSPTSTYQTSYGTMAVYTTPATITGIKFSFGSDQKAFQFTWSKPATDHGYSNFQFILYDLNGGKIMSGKTHDYYYKTDLYLRRSARLKIRGFVVINGIYHYGPWTIKNVIPQPIINTSTSVSYIKDGYLRLGWAKVSGALSYDIYVSKSQNSGYSLVKTVDGSASSTTLYSSGSGSFAYNTTYYVKIVCRTKLGKSGSTYGSWFRTTRTYY